MQIRTLMLAGVSVAISGCAYLPQLRKPVPATIAAASSTNASRPVPYPITESKAFTRAVDRGTRTRTGAPGPNYWQQFARYHIDAELVPATSQVTGRETVTYYNRSPDTLATLWIYLNQNLFAPQSPRDVPTPVTGGSEILRLSAGGQVLSRRPAGAGYSIDATLMRVGLPHALAPHDSVDLDIAWAFQVPPDGAPREGSTGDVFMIAYWYPQFAVYDDVNGWETDPYLGNAEFYMDYADYDVNLTVPQGWLVAATGELINSADVLSKRTRDRLAESKHSATPVHIVRDEDRGAGPTKATHTGFDGSLVWKFRARNVRDFDWGASSKFLWDATVATVGDRDGDGRPDTTAINTFYRPEARAWSWGRSAEYERSSVQFLSSYLWPYPWPQMTALEGPVSCTGMEYPMLTCIGGPRDTLSLYSVQVHETGHMWFPMQVGSDERRFGWQDEGLTRFNQAQGMQAYFRGYDREAISRDAYLAFARTDSEVPLMRPGDEYPYGSPAYEVASYDKMATNMVALRALLGSDTFMSSYRTYGLRWLERHPTQYDFFNSFDALSGTDLSWFWRTWWYETWTLDQAIGSVTTSGDQLEVTIEDRGTAPMPVRLAITRTDGRVEHQEIPVSAWLSGARKYTVALRSAATVRSIEIDPDHVFPDIDRSNNRWTKP
jgi:hypothetical protein